MDKDNNQLSIELKQEIAKGTYSNLAVITHSHSEFIIDFVTMLPGMPKAEVGSRIVMTPEHARRLLDALAGNISKYESNFGPIDLGEKQNQEDTLNLGDFPIFNNTKS